MADFKQHPGFARANYQSEQEQIVHKLSAAAMGYCHSFTPDCFGVAKEPCDLALIYGHTAILVNCQASKKNALTKREHNMRQARKWVRIWREGRMLRGSNQFRSIELGFDDVDDIVILSIINDEYAGITRTKPRRHEYERKVVAEINIGSRVFDAICRSNMSANEFLNCVSQVSADSSALGEPFISALDRIYQEFFSKGFGKESLSVLQDRSSENTRKRIIWTLSDMKLQEFAALGGETYNSTDFGLRLTGFITGVVHLAEGIVSRVGKSGIRSWIGKGLDIEDRHYAVFVSGNSAIMAGEVLEISKGLDMSRTTIFSLVYDDLRGEDLLGFIINPRASELDLSAFTKMMRDEGHQVP